MSEITFQDLALADPIQRALKAKGYTTPSPIQAQAIPASGPGDEEKRWASDICGRRVKDKDGYVTLVGEGRGGRLPASLRASGQHPSRFRPLTPQVAEGAKYQCHIFCLMRLFFSHLHLHSSEMDMHNTVSTRCSMQHALNYAMRNADSHAMQDVRWERGTHRLVGLSLLPQFHSLLGQGLETPLTLHL